MRPHQLLAAVLLFPLAQQAMSASVSLNPTVSGTLDYQADYTFSWISSEDLQHSTTLDGLYYTWYGSGLCGCSRKDDDRGYLAYDLSDVDFTVSSATLTIDIRNTGWGESIELYSVDNYNSADFNALPEGALSTASGLAMHEDLGDGSLYASTTLDSDTTPYTLQLSADAIAQINSGNELMLGLRTTGGFYETNTIYNAPTLTLSDVSAVPLPAAAWLFGSALIGLGVFRPRKSAEKSVIGFEA